MNQSRPFFSLGFLYFLILAGFLYLPIGILLLFSFNDSTLMAFPLAGFTTKWYEALPQAQELLQAVRNSLVVGLGSSAISVIVGTMAAIAISRFHFPGRDFFLTIGTLPLVIPYVVLGVSMMILFNNFNIPLSLWTVGAGHVVINVPYVMLIVAARLSGFENNLEEASMDLGATYWGTLFRVTIPISAPALLAAFLSSFTTSFDEFALAFFLTGTENTLPVYLYSQLRFPSRLPLVVTLAAIIMVVSIIVLGAAEQLRRVGHHTMKKKGMKA